MQFGSGYFGPVDQHAPHGDGNVADMYFGSDPNGPNGPNIEGTQSAEPIIGIKDLGTSVTEGSRFGSLIQTASQAIRHGAGSIELATIQGGGEPGGAEGYGHEARQALREMARANSISYTSVHTPANTVGNLSGYNPQERGFSDEFRKRSVEEVRKAINFAADINAGAVVVHTGEALRDMSVARWNKEVSPGIKQFMSFEEEPGRQVIYMVDDRTGKLVTEVRKSNVVFEPKFRRNFNPDTGYEEYVDKDGNFLDELDEEDLFKRIPIWDTEHTRFETERRDWNYFTNLAERWNKKYPRDDQRGRKNPFTPEELFFRKQMEAQMLQARGSSLYHGREYDKLHSDRGELLKTLEHYKKLEKEMPQEELWKLMQEDPKLRSGWSRGAARFVGNDRKKPTEIIADALRDLDLQMKYTYQASASADAQADQYSETIRHVKPVITYAKDKTSWSYATAGMLAMQQSKKNPNSKRDVFVAPENIFPEMGYGSHPDELIELVQNARHKMVELLTQKEILNPNELRDNKGRLLKVKNPHFRSGMNKEKAQEYARRHIKATLDTQHLGMWWTYFTAKPGESEVARRGRFDKWYKDQVKKMREEDIIGHIHAVDAIGGGHHHLPIGQGNLPVKWTLEYLKKSGFKGTMISEGWEENRITPGRQLTASWRHLGTNIGSGIPTGGGGAAWSNVQYGYFSQMQSPYFIFGAYAPSNDWQLWSQVPME
jgi:sugar phosphate isomerase/epimerase